ncbi:Carminomycin 4-O-methyltransferase [Serratia plymuthica]|uniref:methyltransferase n=1 Tax=Serratia TaxID=613 RepID=UPI00020E982C|nr:MULTISPECIES: methyltransferase [Serratia]VEI18643.1 Carminomycin 4-O-methyltransferase [Serratia plymuthica]AEF44878.1 O-methyltransferase family 2 [Serratia plymuthica AS9]AEF49830.1 O-methyltransferase family 2 [Serratia sp. AS12]AEG27537.1 O-methyltransferase family 2 [Serratia sp. AS13]MBJ7889599.1 SAM-dependent methyltransferase [Serratia sp. PAMC26656]
MALTKQDAVNQMMGFFQAKALTAALALKLFDHLRDQDRDAQQIATRIDSPLRSSEQLLIALHAMGYLEKRGDLYHLPPEHRTFLVSDQPQWLGWLGRHIDTFLYPLWGKLKSAVENDAHQRQSVFGDDRSWFDILYQNPDDVVDFQEFLGKFAAPFIDGFIRDYDFSQHRAFLDIGSGIGNLPIAVASAFSDIRLAICELPQASAFLRDKLTAQGYGERIQVVEGNVITGDLPIGDYDLIHLGWMLHDYAPETQLAILRNIYQAMPVGGRFIASETPLNADKSGPEFTALLSLNMLVSTDGGIESSPQEYLTRFRQAGFSQVRIMDIPGPRTLIVGEKTTN